MCFRQVNAKLRLELHLFQGLNVMSTYVYICSLEVRSWNLLPNPYIRYFFLCHFFFQLERNNFKQNSG
jgi:hypothetical protein